MADHFPGEIEIGGKVLASKVVGLIWAINCQECSQEWGDSIINLGDPEEELASTTEALLKLKDNNHAQEKGTIWVCDSEATYGELLEIENYCQDNDIAYQRKSSGYGEYGPEVSQFRPGMEAPVEFNSTDDGNVMIDAQVVMDYVEIIEAPGKNLPTKEQTAVAVEAFAKMKHLLPLDIKPLEPFEIIED